MNIKPFTDLIKQKTGLSIEKLCKDSIVEKIGSLMLEKNISSENRYLQVLVNDEDEFEKFLNLMTINETYFFREDEYIKIFSRHLIPKLLTQVNKTRKIKILSAGCSTGEEPYSLAIALMEKYGPEYYNYFTIIGIDIDNDAISAAEKGIYRKNSFRNTDIDLKYSYFEKTGREYRIKEFIKNNVRFMNFNLLSDNYPDILNMTDIIFYRNVSIYFDKDIQKRILEKLSRILTPKGYLVVGSSETLSHSFENILSLIKINDFFLFYKGKKQPEKESLPQYKSLTDTALSLVKLQRSKPVSTKQTLPANNSLFPDPEITNKKDSKKLFEQALLNAKIKEYNKSIQILDEIELNDSRFIQGNMLKACIFINLNKFEKAKEICLEKIKTESLCMEAYLLLGIIAKIEESHEQALKRFREALYINSSAWIAHFYMAEIYRENKEYKLAIQKYNNVTKLLQQDLFDSHGLSFFPFSFSEENILHMCRFNTQKLKQLL